MTRDYLFDGDGPPDPEVERLERLLRPLGLSHADKPTHPAPRVGRARLWVFALGLGATAAALLVAFSAARHEVQEPTPAPGAPGLEVAGTGERLLERAWVETGQHPRELALGDVGRLTLEPGSRLEVRRLALEETRLYLERGRLEARVSAEARPRFFQVDTPSTRCVDLGCRYTLEVDAAGDARVEVLSGRVAFENEGREVYVPAGAICRATRAAGAGTPRFADAPAALSEALSRYDASTGEPVERRRAVAEAVLVATRDGRDALGAWHLLADPDDAIARAARARLIEVAGAPPEASPASATRPDAVERERWKEHLERGWW